MADVRQKVNQCTDDLVTALSNLQSVSWVEHDECTPIWQKKIWQSGLFQQDVFMIFPFI